MSLFKTGSIVNISSVGILLIWFIMLGLLVRKTYFQPITLFTVSGEGEEELIFSEQWMGIYHQNIKIGYSFTKIEKKEDGFQLREKGFLKLTLLGIPRIVETETDAEMGPDYALEAFRFRLKSGAVRFDLDGKVEGKVMKLDIYSVGRKTTQEIQLTNVPSLSSNLRYRLLRYNLKAGNRFRMSLFDPSTMTNSDILVEVEGEETIDISGAPREAIRLKMTLYGISFRSWISPHGELLREEGLMGITLIKENKTEALTMHWGKDGKADFIRSSSIPVKNTIPDPRSTSYLKVRIQKAPLKGFYFSGKRQKRWGDQVVVQQEALQDVKSYPLPYKGKHGGSAFLKSSPLIQSDDPEIIQKAREIVGSEGDALQAVRKLVHWIYRNLKKKPVMSIPSAVEVLSLMEGDCNEHTALFTALARAVGIPTKVVVGLLYVEGHFYYHAWPEVYLDGWIAVDPLMNQIPADATHIKYVEGGLEKQVAMIQLIDRIRIDVLEYR